MNIILLSGGSGKRLWPLSNDVRSKQFIKIFKKSDGSYESMLQRMYRKIKAAEPHSVVTIATAKSQVSAICNQLGDNLDISIEPCRRDTFPAIALAAAYLHCVKGVSEDGAVVVCPVDPYVTDDYYYALKKLYDLAGSGKYNLTLMGIKPTYPSEKYGYIIPASMDEVSPVSSFKEKPDIRSAERFIEMGALWNSGVFACKIRYILNKAHELIDFTDYDDLFSRYDTLQKISFDYAVAEREKSIQVMRFSGCWKDLGTWNTLTEEMDDTIIGDAVCGGECSNVSIINELDIPVLCMGLRDVIVSASADGILVSDKGQSSYIKPFVDAFDNRVMFAEKSWGSFRVKDIEDESMTIKVTLNPGHAMYYHSHSRRDEVWTVISGTGTAFVDGEKKSISAGDVILLKAGSRHSVKAITELKIIEVQLGRDISVKDKQKYGEID